MIGPDDEVYVINYGVPQTIGDGFNSADEVEAHIEENMEAGSYKYGVFDELGEATVPTPDPKVRTMSEAEYSTLQKIISSVEDDTRVEGVIELSTKRDSIAVLNGERIRYKNNEADFSISLKTDLFEEVPISSTDIGEGEKVRDVFADIVDRDVFYLGCDSSYASRVMRDPYVRVYGRIPRENPPEMDLMRLVADNPEFLDLYFSDENIIINRSAVVNGQWDEKVNAEDYILVLNLNDVFEKEGLTIGLDIEEDDGLDAILDLITEKTAFRDIWLGRVTYNKKDHLCVGVEHTSS